jgi:hypothetical protein
VVRLCLYHLGYSAQSPLLEGTITNERPTRDQTREPLSNLQLAKESQMPNGTIPEIDWTRLVNDSLDFLSANPLALALLVAAAGFIAVDRFFAVIRISAERRVARDAANRKASVEVAREALLKAIYRAKGGV